MNPDPFLNAAGEAGQFRLVASGAWVATNANALETRIEDAALRGPQPAALDIGAVEELDVFGAWLLERLVREAQQKGLMLRLEKVPERFRALLDGVRRTNLRAPPAPAKRGLLSGIEGFGRSVAEGGPISWTSRQRSGRLPARSVESPQGREGSGSPRSSTTSIGSAGKPCRSSCSSPF